MSGRCPISNVIGHVKLPPTTGKVSHSGTYVTGGDTTLGPSDTTSVTAEPLATADPAGGRSPTTVPGGTIEEWTFEMTVCRS
jgi:hypothetical protein